MRIELRHALLVALLGLTLAGCATSNKLSDQSKTDASGSDALASAEPDLLGDDPTDDLRLGKKQYRANNFGLAEKYFRHAVELHPRDAEAWLGLAAACDRLRRFDLADRAYAQAIAIVGPLPEILNNQGYSYMLRGDYKRAQQTLAAAQRKDPSNKFVQSNLRLLQESARSGKGIE
jgi:Flp pilus assembly protein TadD